MAEVEKKNSIDFFIYLPILVLSVDLFTPYLIWKNIIPSEVRWLSHLGIAFMILLVIYRMLVFDHLPGSFLLVLAIAIGWSCVAIGKGQGIFPTIWGVWLLFQFPFAGLFAYLQPNQPKLLPNYIQKYGLLILVLEVIVQLLQYTSGEPPGDNLAGFFGAHGTGIAVIFEIMVICLFLGYWVTTKRWTGLLVAMVLGGLSSVLGEMKLFPTALITVGLFAILLYAFRHRTLRVVFTYSAWIIAIVLGFVSMYNRIIPSATETPFQTYFENPAVLSQYMTGVSFGSTTGGRVTDIGRVAAWEVGWNSIRTDPMTLMLGYGLGARSESVTFGTAGIGLTTGYLGLSVGTSLLIIMQEMGLVGLAVLSYIILWIIFTLASDIRRSPFSMANSLRYGLLIFSILWPVWLWYANVWTMRVPMFLYWYLLGYVLAESKSLSSRLL